MLSFSYQIKKLQGVYVLLLRFHQGLYSEQLGTRADYWDETAGYFLLSGVIVKMLIIGLLKSRRVVGHAHSLKVPSTCFAHLSSLLIHLQLHPYLQVPFLPPTDESHFLKRKQLAISILPNTLSSHRFQLGRYF